MRNGQPGANCPRGGSSGGQRCRRPGTGPVNRQVSPKRYRSVNYPGDADRHGPHRQAPPWVRRPGSGEDPGRVVTGTGACQDIHLALGVYVLGALGPAGRAAVARHLAWCPDCREELAGLADLPASLDKVPAGDVARLLHEDSGRVPDAAPGPPPPRRRTAKPRRRRRRLGLTAAVAAGLVAGAGTVAGSRVLEAPAPATAASALPWAATVHASNPQTHTSVTVKYAAQPWGLALEVQVSGIPAGTVCQFQITDSRGQEVAAASWTVPAGQQDPWYPATSPLSLASVRGFVVATTAKTLVSIPIR